MYSLDVLKLSWLLLYVRKVASDIKHSASAKKKE
jgi:hypothetical protein